MSVLQSRKVKVALGTVLTIVATKLLTKAGVFTPEETTELVAAIVILALAIIGAWTADKNARIKAGTDHK